MAMEIRETFAVAAPVGKVWDFLMTPANVVACMPGASLSKIKLKIGAATAVAWTAFWHVLRNFFQRLFGRVR